MIEFKTDDKGTMIKAVGTTVEILADACMFLRCLRESFNEQGCDGAGKFFDEFLKEKLADAILDDSIPKVKPNVGDPKPREDRDFDEIINSIVDKTAKIVVDELSKKSK